MSHQFILKLYLRKMWMKKLLKKICKSILFIIAKHVANHHGISMHFVSSSTSHITRPSIKIDEKKKQEYCFMKLTLT